MQGKYRKIMVDMTRKSDACRFWKQGDQIPVCYVESYKEKRALFFQGQNLLPKKNYHLILMGNHDGQIEHQDFGPLHAGAGGELQAYHTFGGPDVDAYDFCLLCADHGEGEMEILYKGMILTEKAMPWTALYESGSETEAFTKGRDETGALWRRQENLQKLPAPWEPCQPWMEAYGHYIIGRKGARYYLGVPGRFLQKEQPLREAGIFLLWQPIRGGEAFFERPDLMSPKEQEEIFGYWIAEVNGKTGILQSL